jgi:hypothetical protein
VSRRDSIPPSEPPPSSRIPGHSPGNGPYVLGIVAFGALIVALLLYWRHCRLEPPPPLPVATTTPAPTETAELPKFAPPPPPPPEEVASQGPPDGGTPSGSHEPAPTPCGSCGKGTSNSQVEGKVKAQAGLAKGCYDRALRTENVSGMLMVSVSVGADGRVCSAGIAKDTVGSAAVSNCVLSKFKGVQFPRPDAGCVVINVPIEFKTK